MISIIIPVYNEKFQLPGLLEHLKKVSSGNVAEIIIVDGESTDGTAGVVNAEKDLIYIKSERGRPIQMNLGAKRANTDILYFLHADSLPPENFDALIMEEVGKGKIAGCFQMKFDKDHWWLNLMGYFTKVNHISCRGGDQSLFIQKDLFDEIGGFDESYMIYEDNEIAGRLFKRKQFTIIKSWLTTSARLYERMGVWNTQLLFAEIYWKRRLGASAEELYSHYCKRINS